MIAKYSLIHLAGCALAVSAFVLGWKLHSSPVDGDSVRIGDRGGLQGSATDRSPAGSGNDVSASGKKSTAAGSPTPGHGTSATGLPGRRQKQAGTLSESDIAALAEAFRTSTDPLQRREAFLKLLSGLTKENAVAIRDQLGTLDPNDPAFRDFYFTWGKVAGIEAVMSGVSTDAPDMGPSLAGWASADPAAASTWLRKLDLSDPAYDPLTKGRGLTEPNLRAYLAHDLVNSLAATNPSAALALAASLAADGHGVPGLIESIAHQVSKNQGWDAAARWAAGQSDAAGNVPFQRPDGQTGMETARGAALRTVAQEMAQSDPLRAANWALANTNPTENPWVFRDIAIPWAGRSPTEAINWLESLGDSPGRNEGMSAAYASWASKDDVAASQSLVNMPPSTARDYAINGFVTPLAGRDPEAARIWVGQIQDPGLRAAATGLVLKSP